MKTLYELGEKPPTGRVPESMYAAVIRPERYGEPLDAIKTETVPVPEPGPGQVLVWVVAKDVERAGNTSGATVPLAMHALLGSGSVHRGQYALLAGFAAGLAHAAQVVRLP